jgi:hypothetical protein
MGISKRRWYPGRNVNTRAFDLIISALRLLDMSLTTLLRLIGLRKNSLSMQGAYNLAFTLSNQNRYFYKWPDEVYQLAEISVDNTKYINKFMSSVNTHLEIHFLETPTASRRKLLIYKVLQKNSLEDF